MLRKVLAVVVGAAALAGCSVGFVAMADDTPPDQSGTATMPTSTPASVARAFSVTNDGSAPTDGTDRVRQFAATSFVTEHFAINPALAKAVVPVGGDNVEPWYVVPGDESLCLVVGDIGTCAPVQDALTGRLMAFEVGTPETSGIPSSSTDARVLITGMVPDGVVAARAVAKDGQAVETAVTHNVYQLSGSYLTRVELVHRDGSVITLALS